MTEQAVNPQTEEPVAQPTGDQEIAQGDDLDTILKEYETSEAAPQEPKEQAEEKLSPADVQYIKNWQQQTARDQTAKDVASAVAVASEGLDFGGQEFTNEIVEGILYKRVENDPRMYNAFINRGKNPQGWNKVLKAINQDIRSKQVDQKTTKDWNALESAVHSASSSKPQEATEKPWAQMSDAEAEMEKAKLFRDMRAEYRKKRGF